MIEIVKGEYTNIPDVEFNKLIIEDVNLTSYDMIAKLNDNEMYYSTLLKKVHKNCKRAYPFWKPCKNCGAIFPTYTKEQALRSKACSVSCTRKLIGIKKHTKGIKHLAMTYQMQVVC